MDFENLIFTTSLSLSCRFISAMTLYPIPDLPILMVMVERDLFIMSFFDGMELNFSSPFHFFFSGIGYSPYFATFLAFNFNSRIFQSYLTVYSWLEEFMTVFTVPPIPGGVDLQVVLLGNVKGHLYIPIRSIPIKV